jgi:5'-3' exonuclease
LEYNSIIIDCFNLLYRRRKNSENPTEIVNNTIDYIEKDLNDVLSTKGNFFLLFDPIPKNDLGFSKTFLFQTERKEIQHTYKRNRTPNKYIITAATLLFDYYQKRGEKYSLVINPHYEADDYVEPLLGSIMTPVAMISTDMDWSRYINDNVHLINSSINKPYTRENFYKDRGFYPTVSSVIIDKAFNGDVSDSITGIFHLKKIKFLYPMKPILEKYLKLIGETNESISSIEKKIKAPREIANMNDVEKDFFLGINALEKTPEDIPNYLLSLIKIFKSRCKDLSKCLRWGEYNKVFCDTMDIALERKKVVKNNKFKGRVKLSK